MPAFLRAEPPVRLSDAFSRGCGGKSPRGGTTFPPPLISMHGVPSRRDHFSLSRRDHLSHRSLQWHQRVVVVCWGSLLSLSEKGSPPPATLFSFPAEISSPARGLWSTFCVVNYLVKVVDQTTGGWDDISLMSLGTRNDNGRSCATPAHGIRAGHAKPPRRSSTCGSSPTAQENLLSPFSHRMAIQTRSVFYAGAVEPRCNSRGNRLLVVRRRAAGKACLSGPSIAI